MMLAANTTTSAAGARRRSEKEEGQQQRDSSRRRADKNDILPLYRPHESAAESLLSGSRDSGNSTGTSNEGSVNSVDSERRLMPPPMPHPRLPPSYQTPSIEEDVSTIDGDEEDDDDDLYEARTMTPKEEEFELLLVEDDEEEIEEEEEDELFLRPSRIGRKTRLPTTQEVEEEDYECESGSERRLEENDVKRSATLLKMDRELEVRVEL